MMDSSYTKSVAKTNMSGGAKFSSLRVNIRTFWEEKHLFLIGYFLFVVGFFAMSSSHWHNNFYYSCIFFPYLITVQKEKIRVFCRSRVWILSLVLIVYLCLTLLWADNAIFDDFFDYIRCSLYILGFLSLTIDLALRYPKFFDYFSIFLSWVAGISAIVFIFRFYSSFSFPIQRLKCVGKLDTPIVIASVYGIVGLVCYFHVVQKRITHSLAYICLMAVILFSTFLTQSRGPLFALLITFLVGALMTRDKKLLAIVICAIVGGGVSFFYVQGINDMFARPQGFSIRLEIWQQTLARIKEAVLFGEGISSSSENTFIISDGTQWSHPHSLYLATTLYGGSIGLLLLLVLQAMALWESFLHFLKENDFTYMAVLLFAFMCVIVDYHRIICRPRAIWLIWWLPLALVAAKEVLSKRRMKTVYDNEKRVDLRWED